MSRLELLAFSSAARTALTVSLIDIADSGTWRCTLQKCARFVNENYMWTATSEKKAKARQLLFIVKKATVADCEEVCSS